jgi:hypothetical protein
MNIKELTLLVDPNIGMLGILWGKYHRATQMFIKAKGLRKKQFVRS